MVLIFRGWVNPRSHGTVWCPGKNPQWPVIDPGTLRLVAQCLNHYATPGPCIKYVPENLVFCATTDRLLVSGACPTALSRFVYNAREICTREFSFLCNHGPPFSFRRVCHRFCHVLSTTHGKNNIALSPGVICQWQRQKECYLLFFFWGGGARQPPLGHGLLIHEVSRSHSTTHHSR